MGVEQGKVGEGEQLQGEEVSQPEGASSFLHAHTSGTGTWRPGQPPSPAPASTPLPEILNRLLVSHPEAILHVIDKLGFHFGKRTTLFKQKQKVKYRKLL